MKRLIVLCLLFGSLACVSHESAELRWKRDRSYYALEELVDRNLVWNEGNLSKEDVRKLLGEPQAPFFGDFEKTWMYASERPIPAGHYLLINFDENDRAIGHEWVSE